MTYVRAADLGNGLVWYPILGVGTVLITLAAVLVGPLARPTMVKAVALAAAGAGTVAHTAATSRAAPTLLSLRRGDVTAAAVETALDRFATINVVRAAAMVAILAARAWALTTTIRARTLCRESTSDAALTAAAQWLLADDP